jgi:hypothetical protein
MRAPLGGELEAVRRAHYVATVRRLDRQVQLISVGTGTTDFCFIRCNGSVLWDRQFTVAEVTLIIAVLMMLLIVGNILVLSDGGV